ncbi:hypothetical protein [Haliscomenobacter hydrossis]|uniref:Secretion system C-terminal sorting domain-containing protein n=1 Tax=Haliscomenobacter hydrossis (strain ATCC 27775 / DSM 1100 / LMG 10767 / O) TaxID=760192 RepID=F4L5N8_HALH1|nr:hypothetical protein [Haliscomenobacter hydrossis]AEE51873.1 hypothetical protein Halhy_4025 [Haliscomenobacter hydrossis DSM 1100]
MKKIIIALSILLLPSISLLATIRIISTSPATASCNGNIYIEATGTAGPFSLVVSNGSGIVYQAPMSRTTETVAGLCSGAYTVQVFNAFGCAKTLLTNVGSASGNLDARPTGAYLQTRVVATTLKAKAYPNPFNADFQVELDWDASARELIQMDILNALGQVVHHQRQEVHTGRNVFRVELNDPASRGLLQVVLRDQRGRQVVLKVMQVRE